jgi:hypothetical protein
LFVHYHPKLAGKVLAYCCCSRSICELINKYSLNLNSIFQIISLFSMIYLLPEQLTITVTQFSSLLNHQFLLAILRSFLVLNLSALHIQLLHHIIYIIIKIFKLYNIHFYFLYICCYWDFSFIILTSIFLFYICQISFL